MNRYDSETAVAQLPFDDLSMHMNNFGFRAATSVESSALGDAAVRVFFYYGDTIPGMNMSFLLPCCYILMIGI